MVFHRDGGALRRDRNITHDGFLMRLARRQLGISVRGMARVSGLCVETYNRAEAMRDFGGIQISTGNVLELALDNMGVLEQMIRIEEDLSRYFVRYDTDGVDLKWLPEPDAPMVAETA